MQVSSGLFLTIDQSTSATKAMLFSPEGSLIDQEAIAHRQIYPRLGWVEHDASEILTNTLRAATTLLERHPESRDKLLALNITNQRETFVLFEKGSGLPLYNAIVWQCRRGDGFCQKLKEDGKEILIQEKTGLKVDTYFPASKLRWLLDTHPELEFQLKGGLALFGTIDTYLIYCLTRGKVYATDHTNASRTLLYDIEDLAWSQDLCNLFGFEFDVLPEIRESAACFGYTDLDGYLNQEIPILGVMGDSQAALFAQRCFTPGSVKVTFGTGSSVLMNIGHEKRLSKRGTVTALGWVWQGKPVYAFEGIINFTGATIAWLRDQLQLISEVSETEALAKSVSGSDGVYLIPAFVGLSAPYWRTDARAAIIGMTPSTTRAHIVRAALEAIGYIVTDVLETMAEDAGVTLDMVYADGGAVRNAFLMQFVADMSRINVRAAQTPELSALGAVFNAGLALKIFNSLEDLQKIPFDYVEYQPLIELAYRNNLLAGWRTAVQRVLYQSKEG